MKNITNNIVKRIMKRMTHLSLSALIIIGLISVSCDRTEAHWQQDEDLIIAEQDQGKDPNKGIIVGFDTHEVSDVAISDLHIFFFDESEILSRHSYHTEMSEIALQKMLMGSGAYTILAVFNTEPGLLGALTRSSALPLLSLSDLIDRVNQYYEQNTYPNMLTGILQHEVVNSVEQVIITITDKVVTANVTTVSFDLDYPSANMPAYTKSAVPMLRAVIELYNSTANTLVARKTFTSNVKMTFTLTPGNYDVRVWSDYSFEPNQDLYYNTSQTDNISILSKVNYKANTDYKDAFAGTSTISTKGKEMSHTITLRRPFAKYEIVATDVEQYEAMRERRGYPTLDELDIEITYEGFFPTAYNMVDAILCGADAGYRYYSKTTDATENEVCLATDYVMVNGSTSSVMATIHIKDAEGNTISKVTGNKIEYKANHLTTISGDFLTAGKGGIDIDTSWDDDINVEF